MSTGLTVKVEGLENLQKLLKSKSEIVDKELPRVLYKAALRIERDAKLLAPVDTGALRASIHTIKINKFTYWVADGVNYGVFQEVGTKYIEGVHFMQKAAKKNKAQIVKDIEDLYKK